MPSWQIENCITQACIVILVLGLYAMGAGGHSFWAMLLLLNINYPTKKREIVNDDHRLQAECDTLVEALQAISRNELDAQRAQYIARTALAAYHKGDEK